MGFLKMRKAFFLIRGGGGLGKGKGKGVWVCRVGQGKERDSVEFTVGGSVFERGV